MATGALTRTLVAALVGLTVLSARSSSAQIDPFVTMNALRVTPPRALPDVTFIGLDGRAARLDELRGRPVLLTFFTTW